MPNNNESTRWLYGQLSRRGYNVGKDLAEFENLMKTNSESRKWAYDTARGEGLDVGRDQAEFDSLVAPGSAAGTGNPSAGSHARQVVEEYDESVGRNDGDTGIDSADVKPTVAKTSGIVLPDGFGRLDTRHFTDNKGMYRAGWDEKPDLFDGPTAVEQTVRALNGDREAMRQEKPAMDSMNAQLRDRLDYMQETGKELKDPVVDMTQFGIAPSLDRFESGGLRMVDGKPVVGHVNDEVRAGTQRIDSERLRRADLQRQIKEAEDELAALNEEAAKISSPGYIYGQDALSPYSDPRTTNGDLASLSTAMKQTQERIDGLKRQLSGGNTTIMRGIADGLADVDMWTLGLTSLGESMNMARVAKQIRGGHEADSAEALMIDAIIKNGDVQQALEENSTMGYRGARMFGQMLPFMGQIMATGGFGGVADLGTAAGRRWAMDYIRKHGAEAFRNRMAANILKGTGVALGDIAAGFANATTLGIGNTVNDALQRYTGQAAVDESGDYTFAGGDELWRAFGKALTSQTKEFATERFGEHLPGVGQIGGWIGRLPKMSMVSRAMSGLAGNKVMRKTSEWLRKGGINGLGSEIMEEEIGLPIDVAIGDMTWEEALSGRTQGDIVFGLAMSVGAMQGIGAAAQGIGKLYNTAQYQRYKKRTDDAGKAASSRLTEDAWTPLKEKIDNTPNEGFGEVWDEVRGNESLSEQEKRAVYDYMNSLATMRGYALGGLNGIKEKARRDAFLSSEEQQMVHEDGMIHSAVMFPNADNGGQQQEVFVVKGNVVLREDGTVDVDASDDVIYYKGADGQTHSASPDKFESVSEPVSIEEYAQTKQTAGDGETESQAESFAVGQEVSVIVDGVARPATVQGFDGNGNVNVYYQDADGMDRPAVFTEEELRGMNGNAENFQQNGEEATGNGNNGAENIPQNGNIEPQNIPASTETLQADGETLQENLQAGTGGASALERIPKDKQGQPLYEQADPETAWDAIVEQTEGDEAMAQSVAESMVADKEAELKKIEKVKPKTGTTIAEKIAAERERKNAVEQAKANLALWQKIAQTSQRRKQAALAEQSKAAEEAARLRRAEEEKLRAEREEAERIRREALNGVPDFVEDTPQDARARGFRRVNGNKVDRQQGIPTRQGNEVQVKFDDNNIPTGHVVLIDASQLQPSHISGKRNPLHFIDEAQPKERNDEASVMSARKIAANIRPEEITSSVTAYTGAPTVNSRGEVIQGNNRSAALREMWAEHPQQAAKYKQYLTEHAADFGLAPEDVEAMQQPVLVNMLDVTDDDAITLGQFVAQDTESGGTERIKPKNIVQKMGGDMRSFANQLLASPDEEMSFAELIDRNGLGVLKWMQQKGYITPTQYKSAFDSKDNLTAEAKNDLKGVMYQSIFQNGNTHLEEMFNALPSKAQKAILATAYRDYDSPNAERMNAEIQDSISAYYALSQDPAFANAKNYKEARIAAEAWKRQLAFDDVTGESYLPAEKYSNFALLLATMYKGQTQTFIQNTFKNIFDLVQGTQETTLFNEPDNTPRTLAEAINETLNNVRGELLLNENFIHNGQQRSNVLAGDSAASQQGRQGGNGSAPSGERVEGGDGTADRPGGTGSGSTEEEIERREAELASRVEVSDDDWQEGDNEKPTYKRSIIIDGKHTATQVDQPDKDGHYIGSYFEFDNKRFGDIAEIVDYIDNGHTLASKIAQAEAETDTEPTEAQKEAGNYKKGHVRIGQFDITVENPKGSVRRGVDASGKAWEQTMRNTYGYIRGTEGVDGDHIDVFLTNDIDGWNGRRVYIVDQYNEDGTFDEHKVMLGFNDEAEAQDAYLSNYEKGWEYKHKLVMSSVNLPDFEKWINSSHRKTKPFAEYKSVSRENDGNRVTTGENDLAARVREILWEIRKPKMVEAVSSDSDLAALASVLPSMTISKVRQAINDGAIGYYDRESDVVFIISDRVLGDVDVCRLIYHEHIHSALSALRVNIDDALAALREERPDLLAEATRRVDNTALYDGMDADVRNEEIFVYAIDHLVADGVVMDGDGKFTEIYNNIFKNLRNGKDKSLVRGATRPAQENRASAVQPVREPGGHGQGESLGVAGEAESGGSRPLDFGGRRESQGKRGEATYSIEPAQYTTKRGKVLDMFLVKFAEPLSKEQQRAARELAKAEKGWYDRDKGGFMMRSEESARKLADTITGNEEAVRDAQPLSLADTRKLEEPAMRQVDVEGLMEAIRENGEAKLSDHLVPQSEQKEETSERETESSEQDEGNAYGANNKLVSRDRYEELKARMRRKLGGQLNMGIDPEILAIGTEMAAYHIEAGARKFADYATHMIADLGDAIRPYLKSFYNGARDLPEVQESGLAGEMTQYEEVRTFDVANFDKGHSDALATAEMVVQEQEADSQADVAKDKLINQRNEQRRKEDEQTTADTTAIASKAEAVASKAESDIEAATTEQQVNNAVESIDKQLEEVDKQLALLGYYEAEPVESDFNEAYGYMRNAEKKAVKDAIKYLNDTGNNDLKITVMPLRAKTLEKRVSSEGIDPTGANPFAQNSYVEQVEMDVLRKPMKAAEIRKTIEQVNKGKRPEDYIRQVISTIEKEDEARIAAEEARYERSKVRAQEDIAKQTEKINRQQKRSAEEKQAAIADYVKETNENVETKHSDNLMRLNTNSDMLKQRLHMFDVGMSYLMPDNLESMVFDFSTPAIFCGYKAKDSKITASTTLAVFATLDGRRRVEVKLSDIAALRSIYKTTNDNWDAARSTTLENWDVQIPTGTRKTGYIMTGNILQAIADTQDERGVFPGQLISYTDIDGNVHDGILMPDKWNRSMLKTSGAPIISRIKQIKDYMPVTSHDGKVEIMGSSWAKMYYLTVPKTKKDGAVYYENKTLLRTVNGGNFYPYRGKLRADIPAEHIESVVKELSKLGVRVKEEAKEDDVLYRNGYELSKVNERFNEQLDGLTEANADKVVLSLGKPSAILRAAGVEDKPMKLYGNKVIKKMKKHGFKLDELQNLPEAVADPIAVFKNYGKEGNRSILTELKTEQGNFLVTLTLGEGHDVDFNVVTSVFGKGESNIVDWIKRGFTTYINKEKALNYLHHSALKAVTSDNQELISAANIVRNFENPNIEDENLRAGNGALTDDDLSTANDPVSKLTGKSTRTARQRKAFAERERGRMVERVRELAETLHLDNVDIVTDASTLQGARAKAKGFFNPATGRITIVIPNQTSVFDAEQTLLHEAVAHYGLRELFGEHFDTFLENVFQNADTDVRRHIVELAERRGWNFRTATEEYLASLAENTNFENVNTSWWSKIKELFLRMLHKIGFEDFSGVTLSDNELRYILWRSYENLAEPGRYRSVIGTARDISRQHDLGVGNYAANTSGRQADAAADMAGEPSVEEVNRQFNEELEQQIAGDLPDGHIYEMGMPSNVLLSTGVPNFPIQMNANRLQSKATSYGHDFDLTEVKDLVKALQHPLAVFAYGDKTKAQNIIVSLQKDGKNFIVGLSLNPAVGGRKLEINSIRNVFPKNNAEWLNWITQGKALYLNKEKLQDLIDQQRTILADVEYLDLDSAANIVKNFENPKIGTENVDNDVLFRKAEGAENSLNANWRDEYDQRTLSTAFKFREAAQDGMLSVSVLQDAISKETKSPIKEIENVWGLQNRLSSTNKFEQDYFYENYYKPLIREVGNLVKAGAQYNELGIIAESGYKDILKYLVSKHGLERNAHFRDVAAAEARLPFVEQIENTRKSADDGTITQESADKMIEALTKEMEEAERRSRALTAKRDYSGLSELFSESESFETAAQEYVSAFESNFDTMRLWNKINAATKATLRKTYESGLISKSQYESTRDMYDYYIPLRGWSNDVASELYNYKGQQGVGGRIMKRAKGRKSLAENPLAVIGRMGQDGILQANKNLVKQRLYNLAAGHETSLLTIKRQWYVNNGPDENPDWQRAYPELLADMDADEVNDALTAFENKMKELQKAGRATQRRGGLTLGYHTTSAQEQQHRVNASIGGREYNIYVNGNPRAAQAINGELRMDEGDTSYVQKANRWLANVYTSLNPEFVVTNYERDAGFAAAIVAATESSHYQAAWAKNMALFNPITSGAYLNRLINKATNGKINSDNKIEKYMLEFLANGGETGFTNMLTADDYKKLVKREIRNVNTGITPRKAYRITTEAVQRLNRVFEDATRFSTYVTSREQGRSIDRAISDAKEISLNFNTRGADGMRNDGIIHKFFRNLRHWVIFTNPSIQGLNKAGVAFKNHPVRSTIAIAGLPALLGYGMAALASSLLGDDDDEKVKSAYMDLPKWVRRTNICIPIGDTKFVTIPLSYELRVSYGMGEMFWEIEQGMIEPGELAKETLTQLSDLLPVSFASGSVAHNASPTLVSPLVDIIQNRDFMGRPLWRENTFNQSMPEYTKAYAGTAKWLTKSTEVLNNAIPKFWEKDYPSPDKYTPGALDINPAGVEHLLDSYLGGLYTFPAKAVKTISMIWDEDMRDIRNVPFFNRNIKDSRSGNPIDRSAGDRYNTYMGEYRLSKQRWNGYRRETKHGVPDFVKKLTEFGNTPQGQRMFIIDGYIKSINALDKEIRDMGEYDGYGSDAERKRLKNMSNSLKQELVNKLDSVSVLKKNQQIKPAQYLYKYQRVR